MSNQYYYVAGNTAEGFINYLDSNINDIKQVIILKHSSHTLKTAVIKQLINKYEADFNLEILYSTLGHKFLDGVIIRGLSLAVVSDQISPLETSGAIEVDLSLFINEKSVTDDLLEINNQYHRYTQASYDNFATGLKIHDDLEEIYINEMDFEKADQIAKRFITNLLKDSPQNKERSHTYHRLFGTNTQDGVVNIVPHLKENLSHVYFIKGRAGTGKSTFMKKIAKACEDHCFDVELYHCSFDPNSIDMVLVRELDFCMFDSTDPHEFFPEREGESIIDLYETVSSGTDEKYAEEINRLHSAYKLYMKKGVQELKKAGDNLELLEKEYAFTENDLQDIMNDIARKLI
ncbi:hypothetical protein KFZ56_13960 [Virgibacillus sp. NKC19-3]|uniref:hypothetical protein n=1 Tax=Virgibacillus saliphilus TaxID=2831674 RepID=UPI001C9A4172|nr:hypothetical protein [Virgibacillus sp. NKC19-3]MBY7144133.1 hypothetical protein [Virgibacillus sp. NKC19-3]